MQPASPLPRSLERSGPAPVCTRFDTPQALAAFGARLAAYLAVGDAVCLFGPLGAGKSTLARGLIRALLDDGQAEVPSPTFSLVQVYDGPIRLAHFDLYRLKHADEAFELGLDEALETGTAVIEWSERLGAALPPDRLEVRLRLDPPPGEPALDARWAQLCGAGRWAGERVVRVAS